MNRFLFPSLLFLLSSLSPAFAQTPPNLPLTTRILLDRSHETADCFRSLESLLLKSGLNVIRSDASLGSLGSELTACQAVIIWQVATPIPFTPAEVILLRDYVSKGGSLVLVGNLADWSARNRSAAPRDYPLLALASALGLPPTDTDARKTLDKGRVAYLHADDVLSYAALQSEAAKGPGRATARILAAIPDLRPASAPVLRALPPDKSFSVGSVTILYPANLASRAESLQTFLQKIMPALKDLYASDLETKVTVTALPFTGPQWTQSHNVSVDLSATPDGVTYHLAKQLAWCWFFPGGRDVTLPTWIAFGWTDAVAARAIALAGFPRESQALLAVYRNRFLSDDPQRNRIDLALDISPLTNAYQGKAIFLLETLEKESGLNVIARFRKAVRIAHADGWFEDSIDTDRAVQLLSLSLGRDVSPLFRNLGVTVNPLPLDFDRFRKLEAELDRLLSTK